MENNIKHVAAENKCCLEMSCPAAGDTQTKRPSPGVSCSLPQKPHFCPCFWPGDGLGVGAGYPGWKGCVRGCWRKIRLLRFLP